MKIFSNKGFTVIEMLIVIAIIGILVAIVLPQFSNFKNAQILKSVGEDVLSNLNKAHSQTLASVDSSSYGVHFESGSMVLFKGTSYSLSDPENQITLISSPANISNVTLNGVSANSGDVYFNRLSGIPNKTGTITVTVAQTSKIITISATGGFSIN